MRGIKAQEKPHGSFEDGDDGFLLYEHRVRGKMS